MPRGDRTGPNGEGPMSGRGAGLCGGNSSGGYTSSGNGAGMGRGAGRGTNSTAGRGRGAGTGNRASNRGGGFFNRLRSANDINNDTSGNNDSVVQHQLNSMQQQLNSITDTIKKLLK